MRILLLMRVCDTWLHFEAECLPESCIFFSLFDERVVAIRSLILSYLSHMLEGCLKVSFLISRGQLPSDPNEGPLLRLDDSHTPWVQTKELLSALVGILCEEFAYDALLIVFLVTHQLEDTRADVQ